MPVVTAGDASAIPEGEYYIGVVTDQEHTEGQVFSLDQVQAFDMSSEAEVPSDYDYTSTAGDPVPSGFKYNGGSDRSDYEYVSTFWALELQRCNSSGRSCTTTDRWEVVLRELVYGNTSHRWLISPRLTRKFGTHSPSFTYALYCGVNVPLATDKICYQGSPDHSSSGAFNVGDSLNRSFGNATNRVYPMLRMTALWSGTGGKTSTAKFRGWDVCNKSSDVKLCSTPT